MKIQVGSNSYRFSTRNVFFLHNRIRPGWDFDAKTFSPDLAIVELNRRVEFVPGMINPICVPPSSSFQDRPLEAYVGGWGAAKFACDTNNFGPNPNTMCKFPFVFKAQHGQITLKRKSLKI